MRKFGMLITLFILMFACLGIIDVRAMSESQLLDKFTATYDINGYKYSLSDGDKALAKRYFDLYDVSSSDCDYISGKIDQAISAMRNSGVKDFSSFAKLPASLKKKLKQYVLDVAEHTSVKATVKKGAVVIYNPDGTVFAEVTSFIKPTSATVNVVAISALCVCVIGVVLLVRNVKTNA